MTRRLVVALTLILTLLVSACMSGNQRTSGDGTRVSTLPVADSSQWALPFPLEDQPLFDPNWVTEPQGLDDIFLAPREVDGLLEFIAVEPSGTIAWSALRPISCTGFTLTRTSEGRALAVLSDLTSTESELSATSITAYDLATGEEVWGPIPVPGPHQGPGLVYAAAPSGVMGETGPKLVVNADTGQAAPLPKGHTVVGEYFGTVLSASPQALTANTGHDGRQLWKIPATELEVSPQQLRAAVGTPRESGHVLLQLAHENHMLLDLEHGRLVADKLRWAHTDPLTATNIVQSDTQLRALDPLGEVLWELSVDEETTMAGQGHALIYLRAENTLRVHNVLTGAVAQQYADSPQGVLVVPLQFGSSGSGVFTDFERFYFLGVELVTTHPAPSG